MLAREESVWLWVSYHFWEYFSHRRVLNQISGLMTSCWELVSIAGILIQTLVGGASWGIMITAEIVTVWPLIGHWNPFQASHWSMTSVSVLVVFWWQEGSKAISNVNTGHHRGILGKNSRLRLSSKGWNVTTLETSIISFIVKPIWVYS